MTRKTLFLLSPVIPVATRFTTASAAALCVQTFAIVLWLTWLACAGAAGPPRTHSVFTVKADHTGTLLNKKPFLPVGLRLSNGLISDAKTDELIANLDTFASYGVNTISVFFQGSRFGDVRGYREDASLDPVYEARMGRIIEAADARGMVVLVGCLYHGDSKGWWTSWDQAAAERAIANTVRWLKANDYRNVFVDVNNEHMAKFDDAGLIAAGKAVDSSYVIATSGKVTPPNADLSIHHGRPDLADKYYIETEGTGGNYWGSYSKRPGLYDYINIGIYTEAMKAMMLRRTDEYLDRGQGYLFASTWLQNPPPGGPSHSPGGVGTKEDPGVRWWLEHIQQRVGPYKFKPDNPISTPLAPLRVSDNHRFLVTSNGKPFFWLADTAWQLIHDLDEAEMRRYFADRRDKGFTVVQTVALAEQRFDQPNAFGHFPIEPRRPDRPIVKEGPDNDYWDDVERVVRLAGEHRLYVGLLPTWGKYVTSSWQSGLVDGFFNVTNAEAYGRFIGGRFKSHANIVWILGGDKAAPTDESRAIWRAMARGITVGASGREDYSGVLMTYHTSGPGSTAWFLNNEPWLDFHALQSGHGRWALNWLLVQQAYTMQPTVPVIDLETSYPGFRHGNPATIATDDDARRAAYWAVFAGAAGHTYGHHSIWQMHSPKYPGIASPKELWFDALDAPSARQMGYLRQLIESRLFLTQKPDLSLLAFEQTLPWEMCLALRGDGFALIYTPTGRTLDVNLGKIPGGAIKAAWSNPRTSQITALGEFKNNGRRAFDPPGEPAPGNDWVLVLQSQP